MHGYCEMQGIHRVVMTDKEWIMARYTKVSRYYEVLTCLVFMIYMYMYSRDCRQFDLKYRKTNTENNWRGSPQVHLFNYPGFTHADEDQKNLSFFQFINFQMPPIKISLAKDLKISKWNILTCVNFPCVILPCGHECNQSTWLLPFCRQSSKGNFY